jgi:hypothetical protein
MIGSMMTGWMTRTADPIETLNPTLMMATAKEATPMQSLFSHVHCQARILFSSKSS